MNKNPTSHPIFRTGATPGRIQIPRLGSRCCKRHQHGDQWQMALRDALTRVECLEPVYDNCHVHGTVCLGPDAALVAKVLLGTHHFAMLGATTHFIQLDGIQNPLTAMGRGLMEHLTAQLIHVDLLEDGSLRVHPNRRNWHHADRLDVHPNEWALMSFGVTDL